MPFTMGMDVEGSRLGQPPLGGHCGQVWMQPMSRMHVPNALSPVESPVTEAPSPDAPKLIPVLLPLLTLPGRLLGPCFELETDFPFVRNAASPETDTNATETGCPACWDARRSEETPL